MIQSRWFSVQDDALAARTAATLVAQRKDGRTRLGFTVHRDRADLDLGSVILLTTRDLMDVTGAPKPTYAIITSRTPTRDGRGIDLQAEPFPYVTRYAYVLPPGFGPYSSTPTALREPAWFLSASDGRLPNGEPGYALG